jgi:D-3-phosphoglycerate dehydrogenase
MRVVALDDYQGIVPTLRCAQPLLAAGHELRSLRETIRDPVRLAAAIGEDADALLLTQQRSRLPRAAIERLPRLKLISQTGSYVQHVDLDACRERGVTVCAGGHTASAASVAELTWGLVLAAARHLPREAAALRAGRWEAAPPGQELAGKTLGVYGFGRIGAQVASVGRALGMRVVVFGRETTLAKARAGGFDVAFSRDVFFAEADVLTLHVALTPETRGLVTAADLARMKPSAILVNTARAGLVEGGALVAALRAGRPGSAAVDVFEDEPVEEGAAHPLLALENVVATPHLGYATREAYERLYAPAVEQILAFAAGRPVRVVA